ncbi:hypothetical protein GBAR_LOCUS6307 [Geodia barretti]|uniref:Uncharacterized protein n=1 Tax=Geodia barretti TaxID=519541 RepID=A0AA35RDA8_GEOBA|nr:hypothetical protein GBAR_LOCUS6307 [Geodia barretti]
MLRLYVCCSRLELLSSFRTMNPERACKAKVTVLGLCPSVSTIGEWCNTAGPTGFPYILLRFIECHFPPITIEKILVFACNYHYCACVIRHSTTLGCNSPFSILHLASI